MKAYYCTWIHGVTAGFSEADWQSVLLCHKVLGSCGPHGYPTWLQHTFDSPSVGKNSLGAKVKVKQALLTKRRCCRLFAKYNTSMLLFFIFRSRIMLALTRNNPCMVVKHCMLYCFPSQCAVDLPALNTLRFVLLSFSEKKKVMRSFLDLMATGRIVELEFNNLFSY